VTDPTGSESEFGRQIPVDLEADADLNEGWRCPSHWSSSLAFPSDNKVDRGGPLCKPHTHERMHRRRLLSRGILLQPPRGTPGEMPSGVSLRRESHSMPGCSGHLANYCSAWVVFCPIDGKLLWFLILREGWR
jgi:hypothetical protein